MRKAAGPLKETLGDRIKACRKGLGLSQLELSKLSGISQSVISDLERNQAHTTGSTASIATALGVDPLWLQTGGKEMVLPVPSEGGGSIEAYRIPLVEADNNCGPIHQQRNWDMTPITLGARMFPRGSITSPKNLIAMYADGNSMAPRTPDGSLLVFDTGVDSFSGPGVYLLDLFDQLLVKRLHRRADGLMLITADNPDKTLYPDDALDKNTAASLVIKGRLVMSISY